MKNLKLSDIRVVIGCVLGIIGLFLLLCGFVVTDAAQLAKSDGFNANMITGVIMIVVSVMFVVWAIASPEGGRSPEEIERVEVAKAFGADEDRVEG